MNNVCSIPSKIKPKKDNRKKIQYLGYTIIECQGCFKTPYYTIVNPETDAHVHASTLKLAYKICEEADFFKKYGYFRTQQINIMNRANKLAFRIVKGSDRCGTA